MTRAERKSQTKLNKVEFQIEQMELGNTKILVCPYCDADNVVGLPMVCCELLGSAVTAILDRKDAEAKLAAVRERIARIQEGEHRSLIVQ